MQTSQAITNSDFENRSAVTVIALIARANRHLQTLGFALRELASVKTATWGYDVSSDQLPWILFYLDAELSNDDALSWQISITYDESWHQASGIKINRDVRNSTQETLVTFQSLQVESLPECQQIVEQHLNYVEASLCVAESVANSKSDALAERILAAKQTLDELQIPYL